MKLLKFGAPWCSMCKVQDNILKDINEIDITYINIDEDFDGNLTKKYQIKSLPTLVILGDKGQILYKYSGIKQANEIKEIINSLKE